jgi:hypothetical protein
MTSLLVGVALATAGLAAAADFQVRIETRHPKAKEVAAPAKLLCEEWYPKINAALFGLAAPLPVNEIKLVFEPSIYEGIWPFRTVIPAYADRNTIYINSDYASRLDPADFAGMLIHELTHIDQHYGDVGDAGWLTEGIADYVRHKYFAKDIEPRLPPGELAAQSYREGYTVTGAFLFWLELRKDKDIAPILNRALREHRYTPKIFQDRCGAPLDALWREFVTQSRAKSI